MDDNDLASDLATRISISRDSSVPRTASGRGDVFSEYSDSIVQPWSQMFENSPQPEVSIVSAVTIVRHIHQTRTKPTIMRADDQALYVVKGKHLRDSIAEQIVGRLGTVLGFPVGRVGLVYVDRRLVLDDSRIPEQMIGVNHASVFLPKIRPERAEFGPIDLQFNRSRYADLALMYGWFQAYDLQPFYEHEAPRLVHSLDHGNFFPDAYQWSIRSLAEAEPARPDQRVMVPCGLKQSDLAEPLQKLQSVTPVQIVQAIKSVPSEWEFRHNERIALASYLWRRRQELLTHLAILSRAEER